VRVAEDLHELYSTAGVLVVDAQGHGIISAKIASTVHDTFHALMLSELDHRGKRLRSCSRGSTCDWPYQSLLVMLSAEVRKRARRKLRLCFTVKYALMAIFDS